MCACLLYLLAFLADNDAILKHIKNIKGSVEVKRVFVQDIMKEAKRWKKKGLLEQLEEWLAQNLPQDSGNEGRKVTAVVSVVEGSECRTCATTSAFVYFFYVHLHFLFIYTLPFHLFSPPLPSHPPSPPLSSTFPSPPFYPPLPSFLPLLPSPLSPTLPSFLHYFLLSFVLFLNLFLSPPPPHIQRGLVAQEGWLPNLEPRRLAPVEKAGRPSELPPHQLPVEKHRATTNSDDIVFILLHVHQSSPTTPFVWYCAVTDWRITCKSPVVVCVIDCCGLSNVDSTTAVCCRPCRVCVRARVCERACACVHTCVGCTHYIGMHMMCVYVQKTETPAESDTRWSSMLEPLPPKICTLYGTRL